MKCKGLNGDIVWHLIPYRPMISHCYRFIYLHRTRIILVLLASLLLIKMKIKGHAVILLKHFPKWCKTQLTPDHGAGLKVLDAYNSDEAEENICGADIPRIMIKVKRGFKPMIRILTYLRGPTLHGELRHLNRVGHPCPDSPDLLHT